MTLQGLTILFEMGAAAMAIPTARVQPQYRPITGFLVTTTIANAARLAIIADVLAPARATMSGGAGLVGSPPTCCRRPVGARSPRPPRCGRLVPLRIPLPQCCGSLVPAFLPRPQRCGPLAAFVYPPPPRCGRLPGRPDLRPQRCKGALLPAVRLRRSRVAPRRRWWGTCPSLPGPPPPCYAPPTPLFPLAVDLAAE